jgi:hypothetical protein
MKIYKYQNTLRILKFPALVVDSPSSSLLLEPKLVMYDLVYFSSSLSSKRFINNLCRFYDSPFDVL